MGGLRTSRKGNINDEVGQSRGGKYLKRLLERGSCSESGKGIAQKSTRKTPA